MIVTDACGTNTVTFAADGSFDKTFNTKNSGIQSLVTIEEIEALFVRSIPSSCPYVSFEILNSAGVTLPSSDALYTRLNLASRSTSAL